VFLALTIRVAIVSSTTGLTVFLVIVLLYVMDHVHLAIECKLTTFCAASLAWASLYTVLRSSIVSGKVPCIEETTHWHKEVDKVQLTEASRRSLEAMQDHQRIHFETRLKTRSERRIHVLLNHLTQIRVLQVITTIRRADNRRMKCTGQGTGLDC